MPLRYPKTRSACDAGMMSRSRQVRPFTSRRSLLKKSIIRSLKLQNCGVCQRTPCGEYSLRLQACSRSATRAGMSHFASLHECYKDKPQNFLLAEKKPQNKSLCGVLLCVLFKPRFERFGRFDSYIFSTR